MLNREFPYGPHLAPSFLNKNCVQLIRPDQISTEQAGAVLSNLSVSDVFNQPVEDKDFGRCCLSGLWLLHGFLDESHDLSQTLKFREGSYWHGIMHREEEDFWNSKYWFDRVGKHPIHSRIWQERVDRIAEKTGSVSRTWAMPFDSNNSFVPAAFVDTCEQATIESDENALRFCERIKAVEWKLLFEFCGFGAVGKTV